MTHVIKKNKAFISYEDMGDWVYLHQWTNKDKSLDAIELGHRFLRLIKKPIIASSLYKKVISVAKRYGFKEYKKLGDRTFIIRN